MVCDWSQFKSDARKFRNPLRYNRRAFNLEPGYLYVTFRYTSLFCSFMLVLGLGFWFRGLGLGFGVGVFSRWGLGPVVWGLLGFLELGLSI